jgi:hypothetical protein
MMLMAASCPSKRLAAVTIRTGNLGWYGAGEGYVMNSLKVYQGAKIENSRGVATKTGRIRQSFFPQRYKFTKSFRLNPDNAFEPGDERLPSDKSAPFIRNSWQRYGLRK